MTTVKSILVSKFNEFVGDVKHIVPEIESLIGGYGEIDHLDVMKVLIFLFPDDNLEYHLEQLLELKNFTLTKAKQRELLPFIESYLKVLRKIDAILMAQSV